MVNKKVGQASSRPAPAPSRKAEKEPNRRNAPAAATPAKPAARPSAANEAPSRVAGAQRIFRETVAELRKVQWPDRMTTRNLTLVVIGMSAALAAILGALDAVLTKLIEWLIKF
jgi:preprotein translocase subunit SecE